MNPPGCRVAVAGGGVLGLTLALRLRDQGHDVTVFEAAPETGGLASPERIGSHVWDRFYHVILLSDSNLRGLLAELGLGDSLIWRETRTGFFTDGDLVSMSTSLEFLRFPPLSLADKVRLAGTILYASRIRDGRRLEKIPATEWLRRLSGRRTFEKIWLPLLKAKLGENYQSASAAFIWAIIARMYAARRSGLKREMFGYVQGGYARVLEALNARVTARGIQVRPGTPVSAVRQSDDGAVIELPDGSTFQFDHVIVTVPCGKIADMVPELSQAEKARLRKVTYQGIVCASFMLSRPLGGYYVTNITDPGLPFTAVIEMTALVDPATFGGQSLVYLPRYLSQNSDFWKLDDNEVRDVFLKGLARMYPDFNPDQVTASRIARARDVLAIPTLNYSDALLPPLSTSLPSVFVVNSAQIANGTLNLNETVGLANAKAAELGPLLRPATSEWHAGVS